MAAGSETIKSKDKIATYFRGVKGELKKVLWPNKKELVSYTSVVLFISIMTALVVYALDLIIGGILSLIIS